MVDGNSVIQEDGVSYSDEELNRIRRKTFTSELRELVDKVILEGGGTTEPAESDDADRGITISDDSVKDDLILSLHSLFYRTVNLKGHDSIYAGFNPFISEDDDIFEYSKKYIKTGLEKVNVREYAVLFYDPALKSFSPEIYEVNGGVRENMVIAPEDPIYYHVVNDPIGVEVSPDSSLRKELFAKHFIEEYPDSTVFIISIQNLLNIFWSCCSLEIPSLFAPTTLYPVFVGIIRNPGDFNHTSIMRVLQKKLSFAFYIIFNNLRKDRIPSEFRTPSYFCGLLDTFGRIYGHMEGMTCVLVKFRGQYTNISFLIMNFIERKLHIMCGPNSFTLFIEKDKIIAYLAPEDYHSGMSFLRESSELFNGGIDIKEIKNFSRVDLFDILNS